MRCRALVLAITVLMTSVSGFAQSTSTNLDPESQPAPSAQAPAPAQPGSAKPAPTGKTAVAPQPRREGQPINVKVEVTITDQRGGTQALKKTVTVVTGDSMSGFIRSTAGYEAPMGPVPLNVDVEPEILTDNRIRLRLNLQYNLPSSETFAAEAAGVHHDAPRLRTTEIRENLGLILENGRPLVAAQSADPVGDRQVTIEVKATVLR